MEIFLLVTSFTNYLAIAYRYCWSNFDFLFFFSNKGLGHLVESTGEADVNG